jgi:hypothetical protein
MILLSVAVLAIFGDSMIEPINPDEHEDVENRNG